MIYQLLDLFAWIFVIVVVGGFILTVTVWILEKFGDWIAIMLMLGILALVLFETGII